MSSSLDLYSKVEDLLGVKEVSPKLYAHYLLALNDIEFDSLLDVGCGAGEFIYQMRRALDISITKGIDLSPLMVAKTKLLGIEAEAISLQNEKSKYDIITAVFDMLNYLDSKALREFLVSIREHLNDGGVFLCDINTLYGFESVAVGSFVVDDEDRFLTIDSDFEDGVYSSEFTLFEQRDECFVKSQETINQYHHKVEDILRYSGLELVFSEDIKLYGFGEADKIFLVLKKI